ncbi:MAG: DMT family transporter [Lachnospiraceae bacterium]|nr:DMT family transporter [Lachnospiraceae bacterium]
MSEKTKGYIYILLSAICFSIGGLLIKINTWSGVSINGGRSIFAFFVMLCFLKAIKHKIVFNKQVVFGALVNTGMSTTFVVANKLTAAANVIILQFTMPIYIVLMLWIFWKKKPKKAEVLTCAAAFVGILFFFYESLSRGGMAGNLLAILSGVLYAIVFLIKKIPGSDFESSALFSFLLNFVISLPFIAQESDFSSVNLVSVVLLGVAQIGLAYIFLGLGLRTVPPVGAALLSMLEPVLSPIIVAVFYGETIGLFGIIGACIVLLSATIYNVMGARAVQATDEPS